MCDAARVCYVGERLIAKAEAWNEVQNSWECNNNESSRLYFLYCRNLTTDMESTDPDCIYFRSNPVGLRRGIPGLPSGVFYSKLHLSVISDAYAHYALLLLLQFSGIMYIWGTDVKDC